MSVLERAQAGFDAACEARDAAFALLDELPEDATDEQVNEAQEAFDEAQAEVERSKNHMDELERRYQARENTPTILRPEPATSNNSGSDGINVRYARPANSERQEPVYRPDNHGTSFFRDMLAAKAGDAEARKRLDTNAAMAVDDYKSRLGIDYRDMQNLSTQGAEFIPTIYLNELWVAPSIASRPFADALPGYPLPATGTTLSLPQLSSGVSVAGRADAGAVSETDGVTASITHDVNEIAGQVDIGRISVFRSEPGLDMVIGQTLVRRYNAYLDTQCLSGSGTAPQHRGIRAVASINTVTYTDATPTAAELVPKVYDAIQKIAVARAGEVFADTIVMHPRRSAWLASNLSSTFPLFQQGMLNQASGTQDNGFADTFAGLRVILDSNVGTTYGTGTNEDEIYVVARQDMYLAEGPLFSRVFEDVGSGNGLIRYQVFAYSAFLSKRYPGSITVISGTGLAAPTF